MRAAAKHTIDHGLGKTRMNIRPHWRLRLRWLLMVVVSLVALGWTVVLLHDALPELRKSLPHMKLGWLALPLVGCITCGYVGFEAFRALLRHVAPLAYGRLVLGHLYFVAQLMKHLPGRVWGVAYQSTAGSEVSLGTWASVTAVHMVIATGMAIWMALTVVGFVASPVWGMSALLLGAAGFVFGWQTASLGVLLRLLAKLPGRIFAKAAGALGQFVDAPAQFKLKVLGLFSAYWLLYLVSWAGYGWAWPGLTPGDGMVLCALYTVAWLAGYFSIVTPSGLGVRELVFAVLAHRYPADAVAGLAVFGRAMLLLADVVLGAAYGPFVPRRKPVIGSSDSGS